MCRERDSKKIKEKIEMIITPGAVIYIVLCTIAIFSNKGRLFENHDEFTHWGKLVKNMFMYNTYGTNAESVLTFNEYPPFTGTFQYLFVTIKNIFSETVIINAQCIMYLSIVIPMTKYRMGQKYKKCYMDCSDNDMYSYDFLFKFLCRNYG